MKFTELYEELMIDEASPELQSKLDQKKEVQKEIDALEKQLEGATDDQKESIKKQLKAKRITIGNIDLFLRTTKSRIGSSKRGKEYFNKMQAKHQRSVANK
jgi:septal ring factor EnvC (AmiA/AmiB activator)